MKGQPNYKITPDEAWGKMKPMLDEAMPVTTRRRLPVWMWWTSSLVGIMLTGFSFMVISGHQEVTSNPNAPAVFSPINQSNSTPSVSTPPGSVNPATNGENTNDEIEVIDPAQPQSKTTIKSRGQDVKQKTHHKQQLQTTYPEKSSLPMAEATAPAALNDQKQMDMVEMGQMVSEAPLTGTSSGEVANLHHEHWITDPIGSIQTVPQVEQIQFGDGVGEVKPGRQPNQNTFVSPFLMANGFVGFESGTGFSFGAGADLNITRKLAASVSAGFFSYATEGRLLGSLRNLDATSGAPNSIIYYPTQESEYAYVNEDLVNSGTSYGEVRNLVSRLSQWQINAGIQYKVTPRFYACGGLQLGLFTKAFSDYSFATIDPFSNAIADVQQDVVLNDYQIVRSTTLGFFGGIGYRIGKHLDITAGIAYGFDHYLLNEGSPLTADQESPDRTDYIRGWNVGLRYHL